ncbi:MAG TPA: hypothetical protein VH540_25970 [Ktedonobacterales bacterium]
MVSAGRLHLRRRNAALSLAAIVLLLGIAALLFAEGKAPAAQADSPTLFLSTGVTNPGGEVDITGTGWAPATHYNLYVYGQVKCKPNPTCPPPDLTKTINTSPQRISSQGNLLEFSFFFTDKASTTTYVFTVVADYPTTTPFTASALVQVVPLGTPTATGTVSSAPASPTTTVASPTQAAVSPTAQAQNPGTGTGTTPPGKQSGSSTTTVLIVVVSILLLLMLGVLGVLLYTLPAKRRAIRAAYYGEEDGQYAYAQSSQAARRRSTGGYPPVRGQEEMPWQGGVASWDDNQRQPRRTSSPYSPPPSRSTPRTPPPRRPSGNEW